MSNSKEHDHAFPIIDRYLRAQYGVTRCAFEPTIPGFRIPDAYAVAGAVSIVADVKVSYEDARALVGNGDPGIGSHRLLFVPLALAAEPIPALDGWGIVAYDDAGECTMVSRPAFYAARHRDLFIEWRLTCSLWSATEKAEKLSDTRRGAGGLAADKLTAKQERELREAMEADTTGAPWSVLDAERVMRTGKNGRTLDKWLRRVDWLTVETVSGKLQITLKQEHAPAM